MENSVNLGLGKKAEIKDWNGSDKILYLIDGKSSIGVWTEKRIKELRDFLIEHFPLEKQ